MLVVDGNKVIETPIQTIVELLRQQLFLNKIDKLNHIEVKQNNIRITCPIHKDGKESKPSCEILLEDKGSTNAGTVHCFACGYKAGIIKFIADCLNINYRKAVEWLLNISTYSLLESTREIEDIDINKNINQQSKVIPVSSDELKEYDFIHPYMFKRKLTDEIIEKFEVGYDKNSNAITFPVYVNGECQFVLKRNVNTKFFSMPPMDNKPIYGLDYITDGEIIVCESVINALTCWTYGKQAVALFGTGSEYQLDLLNKIPQRKIILALDADYAGRVATKRIAKVLTNKIITVLDIPNGKDINDLSKEEFDSLEENLI